MPLYSTAKKIVQKISNLNYIAYFAGGFVRDYIMKLPYNDIDIATNAPIDVLTTLFPKTIPIGVNFGIIVIVEDGYSFEVALFREESGYVDGRRPSKIVVTTPKEDALRRDFTINGMFYDPLKDVIYDYVNGRKDVERGVVRAIGDPHRRFLEDRLRMIRAVRYAARFRFAIDPQTIEAIIYHSTTLFPAVSMERIWQEFVKMTHSSHIDEALIMLHRFNLLQVIFPELEKLSIKDVEKLVKKIPLFHKDVPPIAIFLELFPLITLSEKLLLSDYLKLSNKEKKLIEEMEMWKRTDNFDDYDWTQIYAMPNSAICQSIEAIHSDNQNFNYVHKTRRHHLANAIKRMQERTTIVKAHHLIKRGVRPGEEMGALLKKAERIAVNYSISSPEEILNIVFE